MVEQLRYDLLQVEYNVRADLPQVMFRKLRQQVGGGRGCSAAAVRWAGGRQVGCERGTTGRVGGHSMAACNAASPPTGPTFFPAPPPTPPSICSMLTWGTRYPLRRMWRPLSTAPPARYPCAVREGVAAASYALLC